MDDLPFKALWYPYGTYVALAANLFLIFIQGKKPALLLHSLFVHHQINTTIGYTAFLRPFDSTAFVTNYILLPVFVFLVVGYKFWRKTKYVKLEEMDIWTGRRETAPGDVEREGQKETRWKKIRNVIVG